MNFKHHRISLKEIDFEDQTFCLSYPCRAQNLLDSIDLVGIIHPPILRRQGKKYQIVCGRGRLSAAQILGLPQVVCKVLPLWIDDLTCLTISFEENLTSRGFNVIEQALVVEKFLHYLPEEEVLREFLPRLGYSPAYKNLQFLVSLNFLEEEIKKLLAQEDLSPQVAVRLLELEEEDRQALVHLFTELKPGRNRQRQILEALLDLSKREECPLRGFLKSPALVKILTDPKLNPPQKTEKVYATLRRYLWPRLTAREEEFQRLASTLSAPGIRVLPSPSFEKDTHLLEVEFKDLKDLREKWERLALVLAKGS